MSGHTTTTDPAKLDLRCCKLRIIRSNADIAGHRRFQPTAKSIAIDRCNRRLEKRAECVAIIRAIAELPRRLIGIEFANIRARTKCALSGTRQNNATNGVAVVAFSNGSHNRICHFWRDGIEFLRTVQGDDGNSTIHFKFNVLGHSNLPFTGIHARSDIKRLKLIQDIGGRALFIKSRPQKRRSFALKGDVAIMARAHISLLERIRRVAIKIAPSPVHPLVVPGITARGLAFMIRDKS
ncbi:hypothetical protein FQZ97_961080 [compost metagenome]